MSSPISSEKRLQDRFDDVLGFIVSYFPTLWMVIRTPRINLPKLLPPDEKSQKGMLPGAFLITNILLVFSIYKLFGCSLPVYYFEFNWITNLPVALLRYLLGLLVFSILLLLTVSRKDFPRGLIRIAPIVCYASALYLPISLVVIVMDFSARPLALVALEAIGNRSLPNFGLSIIIPLVIFSIFLIIFFVLVIQWLRIIHYGLQIIKLKNPYNGKRRKIVFAFSSFIFVQIILILLISAKNNWAGFENLNHWNTLKKEIVENPIKCGTANKYAQPISLNENKIFDHPRYVSYIVLAACYPIQFSTESVESNELAPIFKALRESEFEKARKKLEEYYEELMKNKDLKSTFLGEYGNSQLKKAKDLYQSPDFLKLEGDVNLLFDLAPRPIALFP